MAARVGAAGLRAAVAQAAVARVEEQLVRERGALVAAAALDVCGATTTSSRGMSGTGEK